MTGHLKVALVIGVLVAAMLPGLASAAEDGLKAQCKDGGWRELVTAGDAPFKSQGHCVRYAAKGGVPIPETRLDGFNFEFWFDCLKGLGGYHDSYEDGYSEPACTWPSFPIFYGNVDVLLDSFGNSCGNKAISAGYSTSADAYVVGCVANSGLGQVNP